MNLLENHPAKRMTFDKRTFGECSKRMQRITPTLPRKGANARITHDKNDKSEETEDDEQVQMSDTNDAILILSPSNPYLSHRVTGGPIPPPRRKRIEMSKTDKSNFKPIYYSTVPFSPDGTTKLVHLLEEGAENMDEDLQTQSDKSFNTVQQADFIFGAAQDVEDQVRNLKSSAASSGSNVFKRPFQRFVNWMSDIANNIEIHSYGS